MEPTRDQELIGKLLVIMQIALDALPDDDKRKDLVIWANVLFESHYSIAYKRLT